MSTDTVRLPPHRIVKFFVILTAFAAIVIVVNKTRKLYVFDTSAVVERLQQHLAAISIVDPVAVAHYWRHGNTTSCTTRIVGSLRVPICSYSSRDDTVVSLTMQQGGYFEYNYVIDMIELLREYSTPSSPAIFIDIGANIGSYALAAVHAGHHVIAVEPNIRTMGHLAAGVQYGNVSGDRVVLLLNAVMDTSGSTLFLLTDWTNRGDSRISKKTCKNQNAVPRCRTINQIQTITLNDLLSIGLLSAQKNSSIRQRVVMKVDAQGSEINIFNPDTCSRFLDDLDVMAIQVEWVMIPLLFNDTDHVAKVNKMLTNLYDRHYSVFQVGEKKAITERDWRKWPYDVMFMRAKDVGQGE